MLPYGSCGSGLVPALPALPFSIAATLALHQGQSIMNVGSLIQGPPSSSLTTPFLGLHAIATKDVLGGCADHWRVLTGRATRRCRGRCFLDNWPTTRTHDALQVLFRGRRPRRM